MFSDAAWITWLSVINNGAEAGCRSIRSGGTGGPTVGWIVFVHSGCDEADRVFLRVTIVARSLDVTVGANWIPSMSAPRLWLGLRAGEG